MQPKRKLRPHSWSSLQHDGWRSELSQCMAVVEELPCPKLCRNQLGHSRWLGPFQYSWHSGYGSVQTPRSRSCPSWWLGKRTGCVSYGSDAYQPFRSNRDGICRNWFGDDVDHQRFRDLRDAYGAYRHVRCHDWRVLYACEFSWAGRSVKNISSL